MKFKNIRFMIPAYIIVVCLLLGLSKTGSNYITVLSENRFSFARKTVVIDPGHGGIDGGATSVSGILESKINLEIALKLRDLYHLLGIKTVMIRTTDKSVFTSGNTISAQKISDLNERVRITNNVENGILISIHQNYFTSSKYYGPQVFYSAEGESLAVSMQEALNTSLLTESNRQVKPASGVYLMQNINKCGLLIECGFLSNEKEDQLLQSSEYQKKLCCVIASVTSVYLNA